MYMGKITIGDYYIVDGMITRVDRRDGKINRFIGTSTINDNWYISIHNTEKLTIDNFMRAFIYSKRYILDIRYPEVLSGAINFLMKDL